MSLCVRVYIRVCLLTSKILPLLTCVNIRSIVITWLQLKDPKKLKDQNHKKTSIHFVLIISFGLFLMCCRKHIYRSVSDPQRLNHLIQIYVFHTQTYTDTYTNIHIHRDTRTWNQTQRYIHVN